MVFNEEATWNWNNNEDTIENYVSANFETSIKANNGDIEVMTDSSELSTPKNSSTTQSNLESS